MWKLHSTCPEKQNNGNFRKNSSTRGENFLTTVKYTCKVFRTAFYVSRQTLQWFLLKKFCPIYFWTSREVSGFLEQVFGRVVKKAFQVSRKSIRPEKYVLRKSLFVIYFQIQEKTFRLLEKNKAVGLSKLQSTCPDEHFDEFWTIKKVQFSKLPVLWAKLCKRLTGDFGQSWPVCLLLVYGIFLTWISFSKLFGIQTKKFRTFRHFFYKSLRTAFYRSRGTK